MPVTITTPKAVERSTFAVDVSFFDEAGTPVAPNSGLTWSLVDALGAVMNNRAAIAIASALTVTVVLQGLDLARPRGSFDTGVRFLVFEGAYNSSLGSNLPLREQVQFSIVDLTGVS